VQIRKSQVKNVSKAYEPTNQQKEVYMRTKTLAEYNPYKHPHAKLTKLLQYVLARLFV